MTKGLGDDIAKFTKATGIDKLAKKSLLFNNAYVTAPICSPSRAGILMGD